MAWKRRFFAQGLWVDQHLAQWITSIMIMVHIGLATAIIAGGADRFTNPTYGPLIDYTNGNTWIWGAIIFLASGLMSTPFRKVNIVGLWLAMTWHIVWMSCFTIATVQYETAAATPIPAYSGFAMICAALLTARVIDKSEG